MKNTSLMANAWVAALLTAMTAGCSSEVNEVPALSADSAIRFNSVVNDLSNTRAASNLQETQIAKDVQVGVFVAQGSAADDLTLITGGDNALLTADGEGGLTAAATMKWAANSLYFYAYAPYNASNAGKLTGNIDFSVNADQSSEANYLASDLLYGVPTVNPATQTTDGKVTLSFNHALSKVVLTLKDNAADDKKLSAPTVSLINTVTSGTLTVQTGQVIANATTSPVVLGKFTSDATNYVAAGVIVPQTVKAGAAFIKVEDGGKSYTCALGADKTFEASHAYKYNVVFDGNQLTIDASSILTNWSEDEEATDLYPTESKSFGVGDYVLADGSLLSKNEVSSTDNVVGVIFSTTVSETDAKAGYTAYVLGLTKPGNAKINEGDLPTLAAEYTYKRSVKASAAELDGLSQTAYVQALDNAAANYPFFDLSSSNLPDLGTQYYSQWFIPSVGQLFQILNNLGGANIDMTSESFDFYSVLPNWTDDEKTPTFGGVSYVYGAAPTLTDLLANLKKSTNGVEVFAEKSIYAMASLYAKDTKEGTTIYYTLLALKNDFNGSSADYGDGWGFSCGTNNQSRSRVACIATKRPLTQGN